MSTTEMKAGRELDALVAEKVMGWTVNRSEGRHWHTVAPKGGTNPHRLVGRDCCADKYSGGDFCPSTDIAAAWEVVEAMEARGYPLVLSRLWDGPGWQAELLPESYDSAVGSADTAPLAICRAALAAVEAP